MTLAERIKTQFPDLTVYEIDDEVYIKVMFTKIDIEILDIRVIKKDIKSLMDSSSEYWIASKITKIPHLPGEAYSMQMQTSVVNTRVEMYKKIEEIISYARTL
jgi:hypothetical protein